MLRAATRFLLLRFLPRRILPIVTIAEAILLIRSMRKKRSVEVNEPMDSRTAPPPPPPTARRS